MLVPFRGGIVNHQKSIGGQSHPGYLLSLHLQNDKEDSLFFSHLEYNVLTSLFSALSTQNKSTVSINELSMFFTIRCPVLSFLDTLNERDTDLHVIDTSNTMLSPENQLTFQLMCNTIIKHGLPPSSSFSSPPDSSVEFGTEAFLVLCRFISYAQSLRKTPPPGDTNLNFNSHTNSQFTLQNLIIFSSTYYSSSSNATSALDLTSSQMFMWDLLQFKSKSKSKSIPTIYPTTITLFNNASNPAQVEFAVTHYSSSSSAPTSVRRDMNDFQWLHDELKIENQLGYALCGRILPPFPSLSSHLDFTAKTISSIAPILDSLNHYFPNNSLSQASRTITSKQMSEHAKRCVHLQRYINYLVAHPSFSSSFPLNALLSSSQTGLDAAKECLEAYRGTSSPHTNPSASSSSSITQSTDEIDNPNNNKVWVRFLANTAVKLKIPEILDLAGLAHSSSKIQSASLPTYSHNALSDSPPSLDSSEEEGDDKNTSSSFENHVVSVDGFDMLPAPPSTPTPDPPTNSIYYGENDFNVDADISNLRDVIVRIDKQLSMLVNAANKISDSRPFAEQESVIQQMNAIDSIPTIDNKHPNILEKSSSATTNSDYNLIDDLSWQHKLSSCAVGAAGQVSDSVNAFKTATSAKLSADVALEAARADLTKATPDLTPDAKIAVEHCETFVKNAELVCVAAASAKRLAAAAFANDVKYWNLHRKQTLYNVTSSHARDQRAASRVSTSTWEKLLVNMGSTEEEREASRKRVSSGTTFKNFAMTESDNFLVVDTDTDTEKENQERRGAEILEENNVDSEDVEDDEEDDDDDVSDSLSASMQSLVDGILTWESTNREF